MTQGASPSDLRSVRFRREREGGWSRLEALLIRAEKSGLTSLSFEEAQDLTATYRQTVNSLSVAREISLDQALLAYLENLTARAYLVIYAPQASIRHLFGKLIIYGIPQAFRRSIPAILISMGFMLLGGLIGYTLVMGDGSWYYTFVPGSLAGGRDPSSTRAALEATIYGTDDALLDSLGSFAAQLFSHNTAVAILMFSFGVFWAVPTIALMVYNGTVIGAFFAIFAKHGLGWDVFAWLSIHGVTELSAICIAAAGGLLLGQAVLLPGQLTRSDALRHQGRDATKLLILAAIMLVAAALIEGFLRQLVQSPSLRLTIGWGIGACWLAWLMLSGRGRRA